MTPQPGALDIALLVSTKKTIAVTTSKTIAKPNASHTAILVQ